ncbi:MAG: SRPBCC family protein [Cyanobacteria bacterium J06627_8]
MWGFLQRISHFKLMRVSTLFVTFQAASSVSADELWRKVVNLADVSWHPMLSSTNLPQGILPKPGLIYKAVTRFSPFPIHIFVERVDDRQRLSFRIMAVPGIEEHVTYQVESTVCGTRVSYSVTLKGWLSPLIWSFVRPYAAQVASALVQAAETAANQRLLPRVSKRQQRVRHRFNDLLNIAMLTISLWEWS